MTFTPTAEQQAALDLFAFGDSFAVEAGAGTGKTSTLRLMAEGTRARGQYLAFGRAIVADARQTMPGNVDASTIHSLAMRAVGHRYRHRLNGSRQLGAHVARLLGVRSFVVTYGAQRKVLSDSFLASLVQRAVTIYCQTADPEPGPQHVPYIEGIDLPDQLGRRTYANNDLVRDYLADAITAAWDDLRKIDGHLRFGHEHYLKLWQLGRPRIAADFIMADEAQDTSPVMLDVLARQDHAQLVFVGDSQQQIFDFTGAVNALAKVPTSSRCYLTQSFRFGAPIAAAANMVLAEIGAPLRLVGNPAMDSTVAPVENPRCILTRTNAAALDAVLAAQQAGRLVHLVGGGKEVVAFAEAAGKLMAGQPTWHHELACFGSWGEVQAYVEQDPMGSELALLVGLVDTYGVETIMLALNTAVPEEAAELVVSTAHKAKGREWDTVQLGDDFPDPRESFEAMMNPEVAWPELRLIYVAATRARRVLDVSRCSMFEGATPLVKP